MYKSFYFLFIILSIVSGCNSPIASKQTSLSKTTFDVHGKSDFTFINNTKDSLHFSLTNWYRLPADVQEFETTIAPMDTFTTELITQGFCYYDFELNDLSYKVFSAPKAAINFIYGTDSAYFSNDFDSINNYLKKSSGSYYLNHETMINLVNLTQREHYSYQDLMDKNDGVIEEAIANLHLAQNQIPNWYIKLESQHLQVMGAEFKLNSLLYRKRMLGIQDEIPSGFVTEIMENIPTHNEQLMGFNQFNHLLREYHQQSTRPMNDTAMKHTDAKYLDRFVIFLDTNLSPNISDFALATYISFRIDINASSIKPEWIKRIENKEMRELVMAQLLEKEKLPKQSPAPEFSSLTSDSTLFNSNQLKDSILLINFWAAYCKPCIQKFAFENQLVAHFKNKPVKIIHMCIETGWDNFHAITDIHPLKTTNLFADPRLSKQLKYDFGIKGLPHSVLIDENGLIISNRYRVNEETTIAYIESLL